MAQCLLSKYTLLRRSLRLGACEQIISSFKGSLHVSSICLLCAIRAGERVGKEEQSTGARHRF